MPMPEPPKCMGRDNCPELAALSQKLMSTSEEMERNLKAIWGELRAQRAAITEVHDAVIQGQSAIKNNRAWLGGLMWLVGIVVACLAFMHDHIHLNWTR